MQRWTLAEPGDARLVRAAFASALRAGGVGDDDVGLATIVLGELLANACEHGKLPAEITLSRVGDRYHLAVEDNGDGITRRTRSEELPVRGRGLQIVERLGATLRLVAEPRTRVEAILPF